MSIDTAFPADPRDHNDRPAKLNPANTEAKRDPTANRMLDKLSSVSMDQMQAITELHKRGFVFGGHFGTENAISPLDGMNQAFAEGRLYEWLHHQLGVITS